MKRTTATALLALLSLSASFASAQGAAPVTMPKAIEAPMGDQFRNDIAIKNRASGMDVPEDVAIAHFLAFPPPELLTLLRDEERMFLASAVANNRRDSRMTAEIESLCLKVNARDTLAAGKVLSAMDAKEKASAVSAFNRLLSAVDADAAGLIRVHLNNLRRNMAYVEIDWEEQARLRPQAILDTHATRCATR